jgi:hypothetical protein
MQRREFLAAGSAGLAALTATTALAADEPAKKEYLEVRKYTVKDAEKRAKFVDILDKALIPALNRQGIKPVGILLPAANDEKYALNVFVVIPHKTMDSFINANGKLVADTAYRKDAAPIFETNSKNPVYTDCETFFLNTFPTAPVLETPPLGPDRRYQLRLYRSFNIERNAAKVRMFDQGGELPLFRETGMNPIFFGDIIAGTRLPALLYMLGFASAAKQDEAWKTFIEHPKWAEIKGKSEYADTATEIENVVLFPSPGSQL